MKGRLAGVGLVLMAFSSVGVAAYSLRYVGVLFDSWTPIDEWTDADGMFALILAQARPIPLAP